MLETLTEFDYGAMLYHSEARPIGVAALICSLGIGGAERLLVDWARHAKGSKLINPTIVVINDVYDPSLVRELADGGVEVHLLRRRPGSPSPEPFLHLAKLIRRINPAVLHYHDYASGRAAQFAKLLAPNVKIFATIHNTKQALNYPKAYILLGNLIKTRYLAISSAVAEECRTAGMRDVRVMYNGIDIDRFRRVFRYRKLGTSIRLICVARLFRQQKGQDILLKALSICRAHCADIVCIFVGGASKGNDEEIRYLKKMAADLGVEDRVSFVLDRTDIEVLLADADIFVLPSRYEGFGIALVEAMSAGLPVIASDIDGLREIVVSGKNGFLVPPEDPVALAQTILDVVKRPDLECICKNARDRAQDFSMGSMCEAYTAAYYAAVGERHGSGLQD